MRKSTSGLRGVEAAPSRATSPTAPRRAGGADGTLATDVLALQRQCGNRAVSRLLAAQPAPAEAPYGVDREIQLAPGHDQPGTTTGQALLGHELAHVVQRRRARAAHGGQTLRPSAAPDGAPVVQMARTDLGGAVEDPSTIIRLFTVSNRAFDELGQRQRFYGKGGFGFVAEVPTTGSDKNKKPSELVSLYAQARTPAADNLCLVIGLNRQKPTDPSKFQELKSELHQQATAIEQTTQIPVIVLGLFWQADAVPFGELRDAIKTFVQQSSILQHYQSNFEEVYVHVGDPDVLSLETAHRTPLFDHATSVLMNARQQGRLPDVLGGGFTFQVGAQPGQAPHQNIKAAIDLSMLMQDKASALEPRFPYVSEANLFYRASQASSAASFGKGKDEAKHFIGSLKSDRLLHDSSLAIATHAAHLTEPYREQQIDTNFPAFDSDEHIARNLAAMHNPMTNMLINPLAMARRFGPAIGASAQQRSAITAAGKLHFLQQQLGGLSQLNLPNVSMAMQTEMVKHDPHMMGVLTAVIEERVNQRFEQSLREAVGTRQLDEELWMELIDKSGAEVYWNVCDEIKEEWGDNFNAYVEVLIGRAVEARKTFYQKAPGHKSEEQQLKYVEQVNRGATLVKAMASTHSTFLGGMMRQSEDERAMLARSRVEVGLARSDPHDHWQRIHGVEGELRQLVNQLKRDLGEGPGERFKESVDRHIRETIQLNAKKLIDAEKQVTIALFNDYLPIILRLHSQWLPVHGVNQ